AGPLDVRLEIAEAIVRVGVDRDDPHAVSRARAEPEADRGLALPRADLDDRAAAGAALRQLVERLSFLIGEPARNAGQQRFDAVLELGHGRRLYRRPEHRVRPAGSDPWLPGSGPRGCAADPV